MCVCVSIWNDCGYGGFTPSSVSVLKRGFARHWCASDDTDPQVPWPCHAGSISTLRRGGRMRRSSVAIALLAAGILSPPTLRAQGPAPSLEFVPGWYIVEPRATFAVPQ